MRQKNKVHTITTKTLAIQKEIAKFPHAFLVAVVKNRNIEDIKNVLLANPTIIAFSRVQEAAEKLPQLHFLGKIHMIGRLQKNKVKKAVHLFDMIQSVDSFSLAKKIHTEAKKQGKKMPILLQVNISHDPNKTGFSPTTLEKILQFHSHKKGKEESLRELTNIDIQGLMTIGFYTKNKEKTRKTFRDLQKLLHTFLEKKLLPEHATNLSMGMSEDYNIALEEGATFVRIGKKLFE